MFSAQLLRTSSIPDEDVQYGETQYIQITAVAPEVDRSSPLLASPDVPPYAKAWHLHHGSTFTFMQPLAKDAESLSLATDDLAMSWTEKTVLITEETFPTVLPRAEVVEIRLIEISPIENALADVEAKRVELETLERRYRAVLQTAKEGERVNVCVSSPRLAPRTPLSRLSRSNPLMTALNEVIDAPVDQGVPTYRRAFLSPERVANSPPAQVAVARQLETAIDEFVRRPLLSCSCQVDGRFRRRSSPSPAAWDCMRVSARPTCEFPMTGSRIVRPPLSTPSTVDAYSSLGRAVFEQNFAAEIARLPESALYQPVGFPMPSPDTAAALPLSSSTARPYGSISITTPPSSRDASVSAQAVDDEQWLRVTSPTASSMPKPPPVDVRKAARVVPDKESRPFSPTRPLSLFSRRSSSPAGEGTSSSGAQANAGGTGLGRRASLLSRLGGGGGGGARRKASFPTVPED